MEWLAALSPATWFAIGYGLLLLAAAYGIDILARRAGRSLEGNQRGGFTYHEDHDAWLCPEDQWLWPHSFDPENRVMRYRASPSVCNACPVKDTCTFSNGGREIRRHVDPWPASEAARFHRGIACTVTVLAVAWPVATILTGPPTADVIILAGVILGIALAALPLWSHLRRTPVDPTGILSRSSDENATERQAAAAAYTSRRTTYRSDRLAAHPRTRTRTP